MNLVIFSACSFNPNKIVIYPALAAYSNHYAKQHGYKTRLYTDKKNYEFLKNIKYDEIVFFDEDIIKKIPQSAWSIGKLLAMSMTKEPFIHIDFDFLMANDIPKEIKSEEIFVFHEEPYLKLDRAVIEKLYNHYSNKLEIDFNYIRSLNCAIIGVNDYKLMAESCNKVIDYTISNQKLLQYFHERISTPGFIASFLEQILLLNIIKNKLKINKVYTLVLNNVPNQNREMISKQADNLKLFHLWRDRYKLKDEFIKAANKKEIVF